MKISLGNMIVVLNIFNINNLLLDYDEIRPICLIEEIIDEFSLEGSEIEYFTQDEDEDDLDLDRLIGQDDVVYEPSLEDPKMECFAPFGGDLDLSKLLQQAETMHEPSLEDPEMECFAQCGGDMDFYRLLEPARIVVELPSAVQHPRYRTSVPLLPKSKSTHTHHHPLPPPPPEHHRRPFSTVPTHRRPPKSPKFPFYPQPTRNPNFPK
jgi:hypothetical protein